MRRDKVSIIIPVYNAAKHIEKCLQSVLNQTYKNIEIVIINDGSTDNSKDICDSYVAEYEQIRLINQKNSGPSAARNSGLQASTGKYIQFVDSDDTINALMTETLVNSIRNEIQLVICGYRDIKINKGIDKTVEFQPHNCGIKDIKDFNDNFMDYYLAGFVSSVCNKLYLLAMIKKNSIQFNNDIRWGEDLLFNIKYYKCCKKINIIPNVLYNYMNFEFSSLTRSYKKNLFTNRKLLLKKIEDYLINTNTYKDLNKSGLSYMYLKKLILCFENVINQKNELKFKDKLNELKNIVSDNSLDILDNNIDYLKTNLQDKLVLFLVKIKFSLGIYAYFLFKKFLRKNLSVVYNLLKKFL